MSMVTSCLRQIRFRQYLVGLDSGPGVARSVALALRLRLALARQGDDRCEVLPMQRLTADNRTISRSARCRALATQGMKVADSSWRGNPSAVLRPAPGLRERTER